MAGGLGLSPSYLNLMERDQRPLTVQVLLKLSSAYGIDAAELAGAESAATVETLKDIFSDPLLVGEVASPAELSEFAEAAPNAARGVARLHAAYREALARLSDLSHLMASMGEGAADTSTRFPHAGAGAYFEEAGPWFPALEEAAEEISGRLQPRDDPAEALKNHLREEFRVDVRVLPRHVMPVEQARFDRHSLRLC
jgi:transcriptional regulator with XRE-family HTH domain